MDWKEQPVRRLLPKFKGKKMVTGTWVVVMKMKINRWIQM